eukprot:TRINITY_DN9756_c0_g1_i1.p1 TRINITY_DN9756_c0_g1~~TRINITY_DN9756_c0_g1_i1.p1  ORF type:complete len:153 (-),score=30.86 TRINITY_DN9756_c0_g1_i1:23-481(-)
MSLSEVDFEEELRKYSEETAAVAAARIHERSRRPAGPSSTAPAAQHTYDSFWGGLHTLALAHSPSEADAERLVANFREWHTRFISRLSVEHLELYAKRLRKSEGLEILVPSAPGSTSASTNTAAAVATDGDSGDLSDEAEVEDGDGDGNSPF